MAKAFNLTAQINLQGPNNLKPIVSKIKKEIGAIKTSINLDVKASSVKNISQITNRLNSLSKAAINANSNIANLNSSLSALSSSFSNISSATSSTVTATSNAVKSLNTTTKAVNQTRSAIEEFGKQSGLAIKRFAAFSSVTTVVFGLVNAFNSAFSEFLNFNQEIVRLSQVTGRSTTELKGVSDEITRLSTTLGVASSDLLTVTTTLAQAGLSAEDTKIALEALAKSALAPSFENITDTTEGAIAALRQFGLQTSELDSALGSINSVAAQFAVEAGDIITAIQRTGGVFAASSRGVSEGTDALNEFISVFTSIRATTRESAETIATGLRTIFTRIQRSQTIDLLKEYGVELRDLEGKFVGPFEASKRLSEGLSRIDPRSAEFARISEELGGFRQIGKVIPLIQQFAVAQQALSVAQKGSGSLAKDAAIAQQSLFVQFNKTRESFLALIRDIGDSGSFKAFVTVTLTLTNGLINLAGALKPLLPLLLTFAAIKAGSGLRQFGSGFNIGLGGAGSGGGGSPSVGPTAGGGGGGATGASPQTAAISANTSVLGSTIQTLTTLNNSILALNQNIVNTNSLLLNRPTRGFATGGLVPGSGNSDTVPAMLTPGEFVIRKKAVESIGINNLSSMNRYANGGEVERFAKGSRVGMRLGARSRFKELSEDELAQLSTADLLKYAKRQARDVFSTGGAGMVTSMKFIPVSPANITPELEGDLKTYMGQRGFWQEQISPFGRPSKMAPKQRAKLSREQSLQQQQSRLSDEVAARSQEWSSIRSGSPIDNYLLGALKDPILSDYMTVRGGGTLAKAFHATRLRKSVNEALDQYDDFDYSGANIDKLVSSFAAKQFANGGLVQKFVDGGDVEDKINFLKNGKNNRFGLVGLRSGTGSGFGVSETKKIDLGRYGSADLSIATLSQEQGEAFSQSIENSIEKSFIASSSSIANKIHKQLKIPGNPIDTGNMSSILKGAGLANVVGAALEASIALAGADYWDKTEATKSIDFPFGLGPSASIFGSKFPSNIPTDVTKTIGGVGKGESSIKEQIIRFIDAIYNKEFTKASQQRAESGLLSTTGIESSILSKMMGSDPKAVAKSINDAHSSLPANQQKKIGGSIIAQITGKEVQSAIRRNTLKELLTKAPLEALQSSPLLRAIGGDVPGQDTVPALLTPGEFVVRKQAAQKIGYNKLHKLNKADKLQGYNKGGIVGYANGGSVVDSVGGNLVAASIITSILMPEIQKLASSFTKLSNDTQIYGEALSGAINQATSLAMSSSIALRTVGASEKMTGLVTGGATIAGAIGGGITEGTAKAMEKALLKNVEVFGKFDKTLQDLSNAPTEELRIEAAKNLEKTFVTLNATVRDSIDSINGLEVANKLGESLNNFTLSVITGITAFTALKSATEAMVASARLAASSAGLASMGGTMGSKAASVGVVTQLVGKFGQFIPYVGLAITAISAVVEGFKLFNTSLTKSNEQIQRLNKGLLDVTKNSTDYNLANERFINKVLPQYATVAEQIRSNPELLPKRLGGFYGTETPFNELNLLFRQALKTNLAGEGIRVSPLESILDVQKRLGPDLKTFDKVLKETIKSFTDEQFVIARTAAGVSEEEARSELKRRKSAGETDKINKVVQEYVAAQNQQILAQRQLAAANDAVRLSLINLDNVLVSFEASINTTLNETINNFKDLDDRVSSIGATAKPVGGEFLRRDIERLNNIKGLSTGQLQEVTSTVAGVLNISSGDQQTKKIFGDIESQVGAFRTIQTELPVILRKVGELNLNSQSDLIDVFEKQLGPSFEKFGGSGVSKTIINDLVANTQAELAKGQAITSFDELARNSKALAELQKNGEASVKVFTAALEASAKVLDEVAERNKQIIEINKSLQDSLIQNRNAQSQNAIELKKIFDEDISLNELIQPFTSSIKQLTSGIIGAEGTANVDAIISEIKARKNYEQTLREQINLNRGNADVLKDLNNELTTELTAIDNLKVALDSFASSTEKAKYALEKIAESRNLFKTQRQTLIDLVKRSKDPTQQAELSRIFDAIRAVEQFNATPQQAEIALENQQLITATRNAAQAEAFVQKATQQLVGVGSFAQLLTQMFLSQGGYNAGAEAELQKANEERNKAVNYENKIRMEQIRILGDNTKLFDQFNRDLKNILPGVISNLQSIENRGISQQRAQTGKRDISLPPGSIKSLTDILSNAVKVEKDIMFPIMPGPTLPMGTTRRYNIFNEEQQKEYLQKLGTAENPMPVLQDIMDKLNKAASFENNLVEQRLFIGKLINTLRQQQQQQNKPTTTTGPRSPDGASIQNFNNSVNSLATVFNDTTPAMNDLSTSMASFNNTASQLTAALDKFATEFKDGMKGQISYTGDVGVSFNEALAVNTNDTNRNRQLVDLIGDKVASVVNERIKNLLLG